jgi:hypothetical protein
MRELNYNNHRVLKALVNYNNNRIVRWTRDDREVFPTDLCNLFSTTFFSTLRILLALVVTLILTSFCAVLVIFLLYISAIPFLVWLDVLPANADNTVFPMMVYLMYGIFALAFYRNCMDSFSNKFYHRPITNLIRGRVEVDKQPSLIVEFYKGLKNKYCPTITYE